ncbi:MAG: hypothetical protein HKN59_02030 [Gammaproteobacteria bacterium]|nr:hypothetical protein [Gammaproteobacteria bacterium]
MFRLALSVRGASADALQAVSRRLFPGALPDFFSVAYDIERQVGSSPASSGVSSVSWCYWRADASLSSPCPRPDDMQIFSWEDGAVSYRVKRCYKRVEGRWEWVGAGIRVGCNRTPAAASVSPCAGPAAPALSRAASA